MENCERLMKTVNEEKKEEFESDQVTNDLGGIDKTRAMLTNGPQAVHRGKGYSWRRGPFRIGQEVVTSHTLSHSPLPPLSLSGACPRSVFRLLFTANPGLTKRSS